MAGGGRGLFNCDDGEEGGASGGRQSSTADSFGSVLWTEGERQLGRRRWPPLYQGGECDGCPSAAGCSLETVEEERGHFPADEGHRGGCVRRLAEVEWRTERRKAGESLYLAAGRQQAKSEEATAACRSSQ